MATQADVRRICLSLPKAISSTDDFAFCLMVKDKPKKFAWVWKERVHPKKARVRNPAVLVVLTSSIAEREAMIFAEPKKFFTEEHYAGFPAVHIRLKAIRAKQLREVITDAWRCLAPRDLVEKIE